MTESDPREVIGQSSDDGYVELSESFEKAAEVVSYQADATYDQPPMMALDYDPPEE
ncbi:MAG: hypothetical protein WC642_13130 [Nocardioides sp.]|jgi:hypothetical protein